MIRSALVPLDGSYEGEIVLPSVVALAHRFDLKVHLLQVLEGGLDPGVDTVHWEFRRSQAEVYLETKVEQLEGDGVHATWEIGEGHATVEILDCVRRLHADLVALATHGRGGPSEFPMGRTALQFLSRAPGSVLLVPTHGDRRSRLLGQTGFARVLVPVDGSRRSEWALAAVRRLVRAGGTALTLVHVAPVPELPHPDLPLAPEEIELQRRVTDRNIQAVQARVNAVRREFAQSDVEVTGRVQVDPDPARRLLQVIEEEDPELVVVCAHGCGARTTVPGAPFGHVTEFLMTHARRPILVLQDTADGEGEGARVARHGTSLPTKAAAGPGTQAR